MGSTVSFNSVLRDTYTIQIISNSFSIEHTWQPASHCQFWAHHAHTVMTVDCCKLPYTLALF